MLRAGLIILAAAIAYFNGLSGDWYYDDLHSIVENPHIRSLWQIPYYFFNREMFSSHPDWGMYRPVLLCTYAINYAIASVVGSGGYTLWVWQLVNILIHCLNALLVYWVVNKIVPRAAVWAALLFVVHPLASEPVNYICARSDLLVGTFWLLTTGLVIGGRYVWGIVTLVLGLLSKESMATIPILLSYIGVYGKQRISIYNLLYFVPVGVFAVVLLLTGQVSNSLTDTPRDWFEQVVVQLQVVYHHFKLLVIPYPLSVEHTLGSKWECLLGVAVILYVVGMFWRADRLHRTLILWIVLPLVVVAIVPLNVLVTERRLYLSIAPICVLLAMYLPKKALYLLLVVFTALTVQRNDVWSSAQTLWQDAVNKAPLAARPHLELGMVYVNSALNGGPWEPAEAEFNRVLELGDPTMRARATNNLGAIYLSTDRLVEAESALRFVELVAPDEMGVQGNLGVLELRKGNFTIAANYLTNALRLEPYSYPLWNNLSIVYVALKDRDKANWAHQKAVEYGRN